MIDLNRVGGISNWMKVAALAEAFNLPVVSHLLPEIHVHLISAIPNGFDPWNTCLGHSGFSTKCRFRRRAS